MRNPTLKLVMLDCDGVLFDSIRSNVAYYDAILERMGGPPLDEEARRLCHVYSTPQLFAHLYADDPEKAKEAERIAYSIDYLPFLEYMDPEPGLYDVLARVKASYKVALATNRGKSIPPFSNGSSSRASSTWSQRSWRSRARSPRPICCSTAWRRRALPRTKRCMWETWKMTGSLPRPPGFPSS